MLDQMELPLDVKKAKKCPDELNGIIGCNYEADYICFQDPLHMLGKSLRALKNRVLKFGSKVAGVGHLIALAGQTAKPIIGFTKAQIEDDTDRMNVTIAAKVCQPAVIKELKRSDERATKGYLEMMNHIHTAYINDSTKPDDRIFSAFFTSYFVQIWKFFLSSEISRPDNHINAIQPTIRLNFITDNLEKCILLNGQGILIFHNRCRDENRPQTFLPSYINSQGCESEFRSLRSMTSMFSTRINMDMLDLLHRTKRLTVLDDGPRSDFKLREKRNDDVYVPESLSDNMQIKRIIKQGFFKVKSIFIDYFGSC